jgi:hypothetical protein
MPIQRPQINQAENATPWAGEYQPGEAGCDGGADRRIEPQGSAAGLTGVLDLDDLLRLCGGLALFLSALGRFRSTRCGALSLLCS